MSLAMLNDYIFIIWSPLAVLLVSAFSHFSN